MPQFTNAFTNAFADVLDAASATNGVVKTAGVVTGGVVSLLLGLRVWRWATASKDEPPMYPYWIPWLGHALPMLKSQVVLFEAARTYFRSDGPYALKLGGETTYVLMDPTDIKAAYRNTEALRFEPISDAMVEPVFGFSPEGTAKMLADVPGAGSLSENSHSFYQTSLTRSADIETMAKRAIQSLTAKVRAPQGNVAPMFRWCRQVVFDAAVDALYGPALRERYPDVLEAFNVFDAGLDKLIYRHPSFLTRRERAARTRLCEILIAYCSDAQTFEKEAMPLVARRHQMFGDADMDAVEAGITHLPFFWAINGNSVKAGFWLLLHVLQDPALLAGILPEIDAAFEASDSDSPDLARLVNSAPVLNAAVLETLRLAAASVSVRAVMSDVVVGGRTLRRGARVMMPATHLHRSREYWGADADTFRAQRWLGAGGIKESEATAAGFFRPFGGGITMCPGRFFVRREVLAFVALALRRYELALEGPVPLLDARQQHLGVVNPEPDGNKLFLRFAPRKIAK